jgi:hypothetical protein
MFGVRREQGRLAELALEPLAGTTVMIGHLVACYGAADRYLGMFAATLGEPGLAEQHFERAMEQNKRMGASTWLAHTGYEYERFLLRRGHGCATARRPCSVRPPAWPSRSAWKDCSERSACSACSPDAILAAARKANVPADVVVGVSAGTPQFSDRLRD